MGRMIRVVEFVTKYWNREQCPPTIREIGNEVGIPSTSTVNYYLQKLYASQALRKTRRGPAPWTALHNYSQGGLEIKASEDVPAGTVIAVSNGKVVGRITNIGEEDGDA